MLGHFANAVLNLLKKKRRKEKTRMKKSKITALLLSLLLGLFAVFALGACSGESSDGSGSAADTGATLQTLTEGKLTVATGNPAWPPWVLDDAPESGEGYEAAVAYAVAEKLGFAKEDVVWVRSDFDEAIQPGPKNFDFNLQQYSITEERKEVVDFSSAYYKEPLVVIAKQDSKFAGAETIADLKDAVFGAAVGDIAIQYTTDAIAPAKEVQVFNNLSDVFSALNNGQIDAAVVSLLTGDYVINIDGEQVENGTIIGTLSGSENATGGLGFLLEKDSPLTASVTAAVDALQADGTLDKLASEWLSDFAIKELK